MVFNEDFSTVIYKKKKLIKRYTFLKNEKIKLLWNLNFENIQIAD